MPWITHMFAKDIFFSSVKELVYYGSNIEYDYYPFLTHYYDNVSSQWNTYAERFYNGSGVKGMVFNNCIPYDYYKTNTKTYLLRTERNYISILLNSERTKENLIEFGFSSNRTFSQLFNQHIENYTAISIKGTGDILKNAYIPKAELDTLNDSGMRAIGSAIFDSSQTFVGFHVGSTPNNALNGIGSIQIGSTNGGLYWRRKTTATAWGAWNRLYSETYNSGSTANRPTNVQVGFPYFDTTLGKPIWLKTAGATPVWVDSSGAVV